MVPEHEQWIEQAVKLARAKKYDEARALAVKVIREDGRNEKALWIVASVTDSLVERRNVLNTLLRLQPDNIHAQRLMKDIEEQFRNRKSAAAATQTTAAVRTLKFPNFQPTMLYAAFAIAGLVLLATIFIASTL
jgi:hypothetical protein